MTLKEHYIWTVSGPWTGVDIKTDTEWKSGYDSNVLYLSFKGSTSKIDWRQNFNFTPKRFDTGELKLWVHRGILKKWKAVADKVIATVASSSSDVVWVSGFSQGAGVAILCYLKLRALYPEKEIRLESFCSLRVLWLCFIFEIRRIRHIFGNVHRHVIYGDVVPHVPPKLFGFVDVGRVTYYGKRRLSFPWQWEKIHMSLKEYL